jgi:hypothetical protein
MDVLRGNAGELANAVARCHATQFRVGFQSRPADGMALPM